MKSSCVAHPKNERLVMFRKWQVEFCNGDHCAAALLNFFEYWHNIKLEQSQKAMRSNEIAEMHGDNGGQDETLLQFHTTEELAHDGLLGLFGSNKILKAVELLVSLGAITVTGNPNPKYRFDRTKYFLFDPDVCNKWLENNYHPIAQNGMVERPKKCDGALKRGDGALKKDALPYNQDYFKDDNKEQTRVRDFSSPRNGKDEDKRSRALTTVRRIYDEKIIPAFREKTGGELMDIDPQSAVALSQFVEREVDGQSMEDRAEMIVGAFGRFCDNEYWKKQGLPFRGFVTQLAKFTTMQSKTKPKRGPHTHGIELCDDPDCTRTDNGLYGDD